MLTQVTVKMMTWLQDTDERAAGDEIEVEVMPPNSQNTSMDQVDFHGYDSDGKDDDDLHDLLTVKNVGDVVKDN